MNSADANYYESGDAEEEGTTPVGFFNGVSTLFAEPATCTQPAGDPISTVDTENGYGMYDACGGVAEWTQDFGTDISNRATRGGSWRDPSDSFALTSAGRESFPPGTTA